MGDGGHLMILRKLAIGIGSLVLLTAGSMIGLAVSGAVAQDEPTKRAPTAVVHVTETHTTTVAAPVPSPPAAEPAELPGTVDAPAPAGSPVGPVEQAPAEQRVEASDTGLAPDPAPTQYAPDTSEPGVIRAPDQPIIQPPIAVPNAL